jgi:hypothetical protein
MALAAWGRFNVRIDMVRSVVVVAAALTVAVVSFGSTWGREMCSNVTCRFGDDNNNSDDDDDDDDDVAVSVASFLQLIVVVMKHRRRWNAAAAAAAAAAAGSEGSVRCCSIKVGRNRYTGE